MDQRELLALERRNELRAARTSQRLELKELRAENARLREAAEAVLLGWTERRYPDWCRVSISVRDLRALSAALAGPDGLTVTQETSRG